jgi:nicotinamide-nucleotide amidase
MGITMKAGILTIGSEIVRGRIHDTNAAYIAKELLRIGIRTEKIVSCNDDTAAIAQLFRELASQSAIVISTGGLGPTFDDLTRKGLADAFDLKLVEDKKAISFMKKWLKARGRPDLLEINRIQAMIPEKSLAIINNMGTAPGIYLKTSNSEIFCFPGIQAEMKQMLHSFAIPKLSAKNENPLIQKGIKIFSIPEAVVASYLKEIMKGKKCESAINVDNGVITIWLTGDLKKNQAEISEIENAVKKKFGNAVFGDEDDSLESIIGKLCSDLNIKIGTVESCTGGLVAKMLTDISGSSQYFTGTVVTYANEIKEKIGVRKETIRKFGAVSEQAAKKMAENGRKWLETDVCVSTTGIAGPSGGTKEKPVGLVYIGVAGTKGTEVHKYIFSGDRNYLRNRFANSALNAVRLHLILRQSGTKAQ